MEEDLGESAAYLGGAALAPRGEPPMSEHR
ncbi:MAG: hypothetical protein M3R01_11645 [Actinomycetota bacterium]|nr:hypothetical protein [Actinomycetota bacterium]